MDILIAYSRIDKKPIFKTKGEIPNGAIPIRLHQLGDINKSTSLHTRCPKGFIYYKQ